MIAAVNSLDCHSEELFRKYERLVNHVVWKFAKKFGGEFKELQAEANLYYVKAIKEFDESRGTKLSSYIWNKIWQDLHDKWRTQKSRKTLGEPILESDLVNCISSNHSEEIPLDCHSEELFRKYKDLINHTVWRFIKRFGGDFQELQGEANLYYVEAIREYDESRGTKISSHISYWIWTRLLDKWRVQASRRKSTAMVTGFDSLESIPDKNCEYKHVFDELLSTIGEDARIVVKLCIDTPKELMDIAENKGGNPCNYRSTIKQWLYSLGWSYTRVKESFNEVKEALEI